MLKTGVDPKIIQDAAIGNVLNRRAGDFEHRGALLSAGLPYSVPFVALNRQCSSVNGHFSSGQQDQDW